MDTTPAPSNRANRFMLEGVGTRVIRGPDWKWGKQVSILLKLAYMGFIKGKAVSCLLLKK